MIEIKVKLARQGAKLPTRAHDTDAGWDLYADYDFQLGFMEIDRVDTGVKVAIPAGYYGQIVGRSGLAAKGILVHQGTIDSGYRGEIKVVVQSLGTMTRCKIERGNRIAQLIILPVPEVKWVEVDSLDETDRGTNGFGSTGR